ncbi:YdhK family protein [Paenibacillus alginolyticus]|uniref:YdhK family protein n=1 Tax=Paenibacillus alginolyticus TaxID=59839 RepID=A0ABT4G9U7_9BACL|nr:YdhK family protein [Paenibacillus alginolyticus]MCY9692954.1 YdhK family protein [Paenibacillus alginolyticus]MEC0144626.1 YdhK family protein [Paenibacillus alginolyticus]
MKLKKQLVILGVAMVLALSGCGNNSNNKNDTSNMNHSEMNHSGSSEVPQGLKAASNPKFKVGSQANITDDHMPGMKGATATIVGAYDTNVYAVSYTPTTGGEPVKNHKWVIQQDLKDAGDKLYESGAKVVLEAEHMKGMKGATATIDSAERTTIYMVDYTPTTGGEPVKNHKWVTGSELTAK